MTIVLGDKYFEGTYKRIFAAGDIELVNSKIGSIYAAGDVDIKRSEVKKVRAAGDVNGEEVTLGSAKVVGDIELKGVCTAKDFVAFGDVSAECLECKCLRFGFPKAKTNNAPSLSGFYKAETFELVMPLTLSCEYEFQNIIATGEMRAKAEIVCTNFYGLAKIFAPAVNAEEVFILTSDGTEIGEVAGTKVTVSKRFEPDRAFRKLPKTLAVRDADSRGAIIKIGSIEGDKVSVENVCADSISGIDVEIGDLCVVEEVAYKNSIRISEKAVVGRIVRL